MIENISVIYNLIFGYALGLSMAAPLGPVNAVIMNESVKSPFHGTSVGLGAMTADFIFFLIVYNFRLFIPRAALIFIYFFAASFMIYLAFMIGKSKISNRNKKGNYFIGLVMGITNPFQILWWVSAGLFMVNQFSTITAIGFFTGILTWIVIFPIFIKRYFENYYKYINYISIFILMVFAAIILFYSFQMVF